ncbi:MAG: NAD-dependent epimerase/dehydratase family protein [Clostridiaceae bacterium]
MYTVLITGATGFLGRYLVRRFEKEGFYVKAVGRNEKSGKEISSKNIEFIKADLLDKNKIIETCKDVDFVIHAGALSTVWGSYKKFYDANVIGTKNIIEACKKNSVKRLVFVSSPSIYTEGEDKFRIKENQVPKENKLNNYIATKLLAEEEIRKANLEGLYTVIIRPRGLFGVGDTSIIPRIINVNGKVGIPLINDGEQLVDITYVENVAHAIFLSVIKENINGETFNITNDESVKFKKILDMLFKELEIKPRYKKASFRIGYGIASVLETIYKLFHIEKEPILTRYTVCTIGNSQTLDIEKAKKVLNYEPIYTIEQGLKIYSKWWRENND